jgi:hypothetical protein
LTPLNNILATRAARQNLAMLKLQMEAQRLANEKASGRGGSGGSTPTPTPTPTPTTTAAPQYSFAYRGGGTSQR